MQEKATIMMVVRTMLIQIIVAIDTHVFTRIHKLRIHKQQPSPFPWYTKNKQTGKKLNLLGKHSYIRSVIVRHMQTTCREMDIV